MVSISRTRYPRSLTRSTGAGLNQVNENPGYTENEKENNGRIFSSKSNVSCGTDSVPHFEDYSTVKYIFYIYFGYLLLCLIMFIINLI